MRNNISIFSSPARRFLAALFLFMALTSSAHAYLKAKEYTEEEKIGFAFYKLGNIKPNFDSWVEHTDTYSNAPADQKNQILQNETSRLEQGYHNYQPD